MSYSTRTDAPPGRSASQAVGARQSRALLFDLGGVVIDFDFRRAFRAWQAISGLTFAEIKQAFKFDENYERHERGEITAADYFAHLRSVLELADDPIRIAEGWNSIFIREIAETRRMVETARAQFPCYAFTNTNQEHHRTWTGMFPGVANSFDHVFASFEIGFRKPERRAFEHVAQAIGLPLDSVLFFDDLLENVEGARAAGLNAVHVRSPADVRKALQSIGCTLGSPDAPP